LRAERSQHPFSIEVHEVGTNTIAAMWPRSDNIVIQ
jgi:hypothetical protein